MFLREPFPWMGQHSGYDLIVDYISMSTGRDDRDIYRFDRNIPDSIKKIWFFSNLVGEEGPRIQGFE